MLSIAKKISEEKPAPEKNGQKDITIKMLSHAETKSLQAAVRVKYKKAFDILKDR